MMGSYQSCCCGSDDESASRYNKEPQKRTRSQRKGGADTGCSCPVMCRCPNDTSDDGTASSGDSTVTDVEMGPMNARSNHRNRRGPHKDSNRNDPSSPTPQQDRKGLNELHTRFTLNQFPLHRCPANLQLFFTTPQFLRLTPEVESLLQWGKKGSWMNMISGEVASQPPSRYYELQGLNAVPMRFELIQVPAAFMPKLEPGATPEQRGILKTTYRDIFAAELGIELTFVQEPINDVVYSNGVSGTTPSLLSALTYIPFLFKELSLYPKSFLQKAGLRRIILCEGLNYSGQVRKAIPVVVSNSLYLDVTIEPIYYMQGVLHHEFFHLFDDKILFELKKPVKNPLAFYNPSDPQATRRLPHDLNDWFLEGGAKAKEVELIAPVVITPTPSEPITNTQTVHENGDIVIDIQSLVNDATATHPTRTSPIPTSESTSIPQVDPTIPQFNPTVDQFTMFCLNLITEYLFQRQLVFKPTVLPTIIQHYLDSRAKYLEKHPNETNNAANTQSLTSHNTTSSNSNQPQKTLAPLDPKFITNKLLQILSKLFQLEPYFFRSFPAILHLFKHPNYQQQQTKFIRSGEKRVTDDITSEQHELQSKSTPLESLDFFPVAAVPLIPTTPMKFPQPQPNRIDQYLSIPPVFLLRPQYHEKTTGHYENELRLYNNPGSDGGKVGEHGDATLPPIDITNYPSLTISLHELFHTSLPNYSRGKIYLSYYRTIAVSDYIPQEFNHPFFPHRRYMYQKHNLEVPQTVAAIPNQWCVTADEEPFTRFSYAFPPLECFQHLFWTQATTEAIRNGIDPMTAPVTPEPPTWHSPTLPLRQESVGSDPLWLLLNFKRFRYGPGGGNYRHADASVTLQKDHHEDEHYNNHIESAKRSKNNKKLKTNNSNHNRDPQTLVSLSNHTLGGDTTHGSGNGDISDRGGDETDCANELDQPSRSSSHSISSSSSIHSTSNRDSFSLLQPQQSFSQINAGPRSKKNQSTGPTSQEQQAQDDSIGFLNTYSMSAIEEDKAEVFSWLIRHPPAILNSPDQYLRAKGLELWRRLELFCPDIDEHFLKKLIQHKPFKIDPAGWVCKTDSRGYTNWQNTLTTQVSWVDPAMFMSKMLLFDDDHDDGDDGDDDDNRSTTTQK